MELQASEHEICVKVETSTHYKSSTVVIKLSLLDESWLSIQIGTRQKKIILVDELKLESHGDINLLNIGIVAQFTRYKLINPSK